MSLILQWGGRGLHANWDQANVSLRKNPQEQFKKLVRNEGQKAVGQKHSRLPEGSKILSLEASIISDFSVSVPQTFHFQSRKKQRKKIALLNLSLSYVLQTIAPYLPFYLKIRSLPRTTVPGKQVILKEKCLWGQHSIWVHCSHGTPWSGESSWVCAREAPRPRKRDHTFAHRAIRPWKGSWV